MKYTPDIVDLQSWFTTSADPQLKQIWEASKYLSNPYAFWLSVWNAAGCPNLETTP